MADKAELNLPIINAIDELKESNKDQRQRLQKSMRAGLLNVKKSVDALSFSFERSLIDQSHAQERMHDATMAFQEASLEQGKHSGHLFAAKMTAVGAGLVAWFENKLLKEFGELRKSVDEGKVIHHDYTIEEGSYDKVLNQIEKHTGITRTYVKTISKTLKDAFGITEQEEARKELNNLFEEQKKWYKVSAKKTEETNEILKDSLPTPEEKREEARARENAIDSGTDDDVLKSPLQPKDNWFARLLKGLGILTAGWVVFDNWEEIKEGLIKIKDFLHDVYIHVSENSEIYGGIATLIGSVWLLSKGWLVSLAIIQGTSSVLAGTFKHIANAFKLIKKAFLPLTVLFAGWEAYNKAMEEYEKTGDWGKAIDVFGYNFIKELIVGPLTLFQSIGSWILDKLGFDELSKQWDEIDISKEYDRIRNAVDETLWNAIDWVDGKLKDGWKFITETSPEWIGQKYDELKQVFIDLYDDAINWIDETFSWENLKQALGFGDKKSVMQDVNVKPSEKLTKEIKQAIEDQKAADRITDAWRKQLHGVSTDNIPSGNGAGETMMIKGTVDGKPISAPIVTNAPTTITNQNNTNNNTTITAPLNTTPTPAINYIPGDSDLWIAP